VADEADACGHGRDYSCPVGALKAGNPLSAEADAELSPGHAREHKNNRGHGPLLQNHMN
jgi:hypothetical protein